MVLLIAVLMAATTTAATPRPTPPDTREVILKTQRRAAGLLDSAAENMSAGDEEAIAQDLSAASGAIDSILMLARPAGEKPLLPAPLVGKLEALRDQLRTLAKKPATASLTFRLPACLEVLEQIPPALAPPRPRPRPAS